MAPSRRALIASRKRKIRDDETSIDRLALARTAVAKKRMVPSRLPTSARDTPDDNQHESR